MESYLNDRTPRNELLQAKRLVEVTDCNRRNVNSHQFPFPVGRRTFGEGHFEPRLDLACPFDTLLE